MPNLELPLLVVDDARFSSLVVSRTLKRAGYHDVRTANDGPSALHEMSQRPARIVIADWLMPVMDGLTLTSRIREQDERDNRYTYIILLTGNETDEALTRAFERGVDDFIHKSAMQHQLLPRVHAAGRLADRHSRLLLDYALVQRRNRWLESINILDPDTGLGNASLARDQLQRSLRHTESRGGATALVLIEIHEWEKLLGQYGPTVMRELANGVGRRLRSLSRPLDTVCRPESNRYSVIAHFPSEEDCSRTTFRRLYEGIRHKSIQTSAGFIPVEASLTLCHTSDSSELPGPELIERAAEQGLSEALNTQRFTEITARADTAGAPPLTA